MTSLAVLAPALTAGIGAAGAGLLAWSLARLFLERLSPVPSASRPLRVRVPLLSGKAPAWFRKREERKRIEKMSDLFPATLGMAVQALKTGQTIPQVIQYLSRECPPPLKGEWGMVCAEMDLGASAEQALLKMSERHPGFLELREFLESYRISRRTGANLARLLEVQVEGLETKNRILRRMEALTAQARLSGLMMGLLPFLLGAVFFVMDPELMTPLFTQKAGAAILLMAAFLETVGFLWIRSLLRLEF